MSKKKYAELLLKTSTVIPAADRHGKPDLSAPPSTGWGLTTQRILLEQEITILQKRRDELIVENGGAAVKHGSLEFVEPVIGTGFISGNGRLKQKVATLQRQIGELEASHKDE